MKKITLLFAIHNHQPVGTLDHLIEDSYQQAYLPFLQTIQNHPRIRFTLSYSGVLYDWLVANHPEFIDLLKKLIKRGQVELLSGGYYEPIMGLIPDQDKLGQIKMQNDFLTKNFGQMPTGLWLAKLYWLPSLAKILNQSQIEYTILDQELFLAAGLKPEDLDNYFWTEDQGYSLKIFPTNKELLRQVTSKNPEEVIDFLRNKAQNESQVMLCADDGQIFGQKGAWAEKFYKRGQFDKLLTLLETNFAFVSVMTAKQYLDEYQSTKRIYLSSGASAQVNNWLKDSAFANFLLRYPQANNMHKKMLQVSSKLQSLRKVKNILGGYDLSQAERELYQAQSGSAYWPGDFGGVYFNHLRQAVFRHLIKAENELQNLNRSNDNFVELTVADLNKDGADEVVMANSMLALYCDPKRGGTIYELDYRPKACNLVNGLFTRGLLWEHCFDPSLSFDDFQAKRKKASNFVYNFMPRRKAAEVKLDLSCQTDYDNLPLKIEKNIALATKLSVLEIEYCLTNLSSKKLSFKFGLEFDFSCFDLENNQGYYKIAGQKVVDNKLASSGVLDDVRAISLVDEQVGFELSLESNKLANLWRFPERLTFSSEGKRLESYQSCLLFFHWQLELDPGEVWTNKVVLRIEE